HSSAPVCNIEQRGDISLPYLLRVQTPMCPNCRSTEPTVTHESVGTGFYFCRACEHAWYEERRAAPRPPDTHRRGAPVKVTGNATPQKRDAETAEGSPLPSQEA